MRGHRLYGPGCPAAGPCVATCLGDWLSCHETAVDWNYPSFSPAHPAVPPIPPPSPSAPEPGPERADQRVFLAVRQMIEVRELCHQKLESWPPWSCQDPGG